MAWNTQCAQVFKGAHAAALENRLDVIGMPQMAL